MDRNSILTLLNNIKTRRLIGRVQLETVCFALAEGLINRTEEGNFKASQKGEDYIKSEVIRHSSPQLQIRYSH
ncbi:MAG: hypothetical protein ACHQHN_03850 [Sphingobacteriales bacterium]